MTHWHSSTDSWPKRIVDHCIIIGITDLNIVLDLDHPLLIITTIEAHLEVDMAGHLHMLTGNILR